MATTFFDGWTRGVWALTLALPPLQEASPLESQLLREPRAALVSAARAHGDARRGAAVFFQPGLACARCHAAGEARANAIGPDLAQLGAEVDDLRLVEALLQPSALIRDGYRSALVRRHDRTFLDGIVVQRTDASLVLRDAATGATTTLAIGDVESVRESRVSAMPAGQMAQLASRQQFLDLVRWLIEVRDGGPTRARELEPPPELRRLVLPDYEARVDHAALTRGLDAAAFERGAAIYQRVCANCHGTLDREGSLPSSLRFATGRFKNGSDPLALYKTLTHGFGAMAPQTWMVPRQKYDVIHYLREAYLRPHNGTQYVAVDAEYLAALPPGDTLGPEAASIEPWVAMDYGASFSHTVEVPGGSLGVVDRDGAPLPNFAYKGWTVRLDAGAGGVARGAHWLLYDLDTLRVAAAWSAPDDAGGTRFLDWRGIQLNGEHAVHPKLVGRVAFANPIAPGFAQPGSASFRDDARVVGRDGRRYGPLPREWARLRGIHLCGAERVLEMSVGATRVLEMPTLAAAVGHTPRFVRHFEIAPRAEAIELQVAQLGADAVLRGEGARARFGPPPVAPLVATEARPLRFDGATWLERPLSVAGGESLDFTSGDFTLAARIRTKAGGTIVAIAPAGEQWAPDGQTLFVRDGRLNFDIGWVGCITTSGRVDDGAWHEVAANWRRADRHLELWIDGKLDAGGSLAPNAALPDARLRVGYTSVDFPAPQSAFDGEIESLRIDRGATTMVRWRFADASGARAAADGAAGAERALAVRRGDARVVAAPPALTVGFDPPGAPLSFFAEQGALRLAVAAGEAPLRFSLWCEEAGAAPLAARPDASAAAVPLDLSARTHGGPPRCPEVLTTRLLFGGNEGPFAIDVAELPDANPWLAQIRPSGLDFLPDGRLAMCTWDGDVWLAEIVAAASDGVPASASMRWRRIASGLFQPLGLKVVDGLIHLTCRDALVVLHDRNGDEEIDFVEWLNSDHQVTEHFHEFAMGLEQDRDGSFVYAKSGRHALDALVPQHGTVLRVARDGARTDVLARGLRAANGICVNPDGTLVVTDQEGFWIPKNRLNWITPAADGGARFYGNMLGWHDAGLSASDDAMEPPLCWLTNDFDRSPAEAQWVRSASWGALDGALLCSSYGEGKLFVVLHEPVPAGGRGAQQGGEVALPGANFPTGVMRGRFASGDGSLWTCGLFAWAGDATQPGGLYRVRRTARPLRIPLALAATERGLRLRFAEPLERVSVTPAAFALKVWSLRRSANYGSAHHDERVLPVTAVRLDSDAQTVELDFEGLAPTWCYELHWQLRAADGGAVDGVLDGTLHALPPAGQ